MGSNRSVGTASIAVTLPPTTRTVPSCRSAARWPERATAGGGSGLQPAGPGGRVGVAVAVGVGAGAAGVGGDEGEGMVIAAGEDGAYTSAMADGAIEGAAAVVQ